MSPNGGVPVSRQVEEPFKFLNYYEERDQKIFAGRDREIREVTARVTTARTLVVYGRSGLGKTSLLMAGVFPLLRQQGLTPVYVRTLTSPLGDLERAVTLETGVELDGTDPQATVRKAAIGRKLVLVFDQFEEFFIRFAADDEASRSFANVIAEIAGDTSVNVHLIFSLREDYLAQLDDFRQGLPDLFLNEYRVMPLTAFGVRRAVTRPLIEKGIAFKPRLIDRIVNETAETGYDPVLLQILCHEVFHEALARSPEEPLLIEEDLNAVGGLTEIFQSYVSRIADAVPKAQHFLVRLILDGFITHERTKRALTIETLLEQNFHASPEEILTVIEVLVGTHLVRRSVSVDGSWYELTHERLVDSIVGWLELDEEYFNYRLARDQVTTFSRGEVWRDNAAGLLPIESVQGLIDRFKERLILSNIQKEFLLRSAIYSCAARETVSYWRDSLTEEVCLQVMQSLLDSDNPQSRKHAAKVADLFSLDAQSMLQYAMRDSEEEVRRVAGRAFARKAGDDDLRSFKDMLSRRTTRKKAQEVLADVYGEEKLTPQTV